MIYRFRILSNEEEDFLREIEVLSGQSFLDFHNAIQDSVGYDQSQMCSFFISGESWEKGQEITLLDMGEGMGEEKVEMKNALLSEYIGDKGQRLLYVFDFFSERAFFIELVELIDRNPKVEFPRCIISEGMTPVQIKIADLSDELPEDDFFDSDDFDDSDQDFDISELDDYSDEAIS